MVSSIPLSTLITAGLVFLAVALGAISLAFLLELAQEHQRHRQVLKQLRALDASAQESSGLFRFTGGNAPRWAERLAAKSPALSDLQLIMQQAGSTWTLEAFLLLTIGLGLAAGLAALFASGSLVVGAAGAFLATLIPFGVLRHRRRQRLDTFEAMLPGAIDLLARAIRAGHPLSAGLEMVADEAQDPIASEFRRTYEEQRFGLPFEDAISALGDRVNLVDVRILITAILIQRVVGGNLAEVLDNLAGVIRARFRIRRQLRTYTAQGRISGYVLAILPVAVGSVIYLLNPGYLSLLFDTDLGRFLLGTAVVMQVLGYIWIRKIVNIEI